MSKTIFKDQFYTNAESFIPVCCHFDNRTLLTKNGELVQSIQVNGINQENISKNLLSLREIIRNSLREFVDTTDLACWIHTIRKKVSLDDPQKYPTEISQVIHNRWVRKNYWDDKFVNTLFISFVYKGSNFDIKNPNFLKSSFNPQKIIEEHNNKLIKARDRLDQIVTNITNRLDEFGSKRLGIVYEGDDAYCEILQLLYSVLRGIEVPIKLDIKDLSKIIGSFNYAVGSNKIEVISSEERKYASILSLKEYQEISAKSLDKILQQPTEFVITEVFHFLDPKIAKKSIEHQNYIINVSKDERLAESKGIKRILESEKKFKYPYCNQQISILLLNEDIENLDKSTANISFQLARLGLVHVREDINVENAFWAQIPGNFKFLRRLNTMTVDTVASMASLHNFPSGSHMNSWGRAVTILRTERGTPFFFNFHSAKGTARTLLIGTAKSGKTVIANFLVSEAMKYNPKILFIAHAKDSYSFIKTNNGKWVEPYKLDPFKVTSIGSNDILVKEILRGIALISQVPLSELEEKLLQNLQNYFVGMPIADRSFIKLKDFDFSVEGGEAFKKRFQDYLPEGEYYENFIEDGRFDQEITNIISIDFSNYTDAVFAKANYPSEDRFLSEYKHKFDRFSIFREILVLANTLKYMDHFKSKKMIIKIENFNNLCSAKFSKSFYDEYFKAMDSQNIIYINSIKFINDSEFYSSELWKNMQELFETKIYLSAESVTYHWKDKLYLSEQEYNKIKSIVPASRLFLVKQDGLVISCELSLGGLPAILWTLSSDSKIIAKCDEFAQRNNDKWMLEFYESLS